MTEVGGEPEMVGAALGRPSTTTANAGRDAVSWPSDTLIRMSAYTPSSPADGVPESRPESGLKLAHGGAIAITGVALQLSGFEPNAVQDAPATLALRLVFAGLAPFAFVVGIALLGGLDLSEGTHRRVRAALDPS